MNELHRQRARDEEREMQTRNRIAIKVKLIILTSGCFFISSFHLF